jgi:hypothetical protein
MYFFLTPESFVGTRRGELRPISYAGGSVKGGVLFSVEKE